MGRANICRSGVSTGERDSYPETQRWGSRRVEGEVVAVVKEARGSFTGATMTGLCELCWRNTTESQHSVFNAQCRAVPWSMSAHTPLSFTCEQNQSVVSDKLLPTGGSRARSISFSECVRACKSSSMLRNSHLLFIGGNEGREGRGGRGGEEGGGALNLLNPYTLNDSTVERKETISASPVSASLHWSSFVYSGSRTSWF